MRKSIALAAAVSTLLVGCMSTPGPIHTPKMNSKTVFYAVPENAPMYSTEYLMDDLPAIPHLECAKRLIQVPENTIKYLRVVSGGEYVDTIIMISGDAAYNSYHDSKTGAPLYSEAFIINSDNTWTSKKVYNSKSTMNLMYKICATVLNGKLKEGSSHEI